ncbi:MAG: EAL domain-containing protein [Burkholderiales bacterium]|nr:EAL domain-containing protein [Burkholderiales bacterium]
MSLAPAMTGNASDKPSADDALRLMSTATLVMLYLAIAGLDLSGLLRPLSTFATDFRFFVTQREPTGRVVLLDIDQKSIASVGVWPWPRDVHASILDRLREAGAVDVAMDVDFSSRSDESGDGAFEAALERFGGGVILASFRQVASAQETTLSVVEPLERFQNHAWPALVDVIVDPDGAVRTMLFGGISGDRTLPGLAPLLAGKAYPASGGFLVDYSIRHDGIDRVSVSALLDGSVDPARLTGKKVIVGSSASSLHDFFHVPVSAAMPGALLQAIGLETLLQDRVLVPAGREFRLAGLAVLMAAGLLALWTVGYGWIALAAAVVVAVVETAAIVLQARTAVVVETVPWHLACLSMAGVAVACEVRRRRVLWLFANRDKGRVQAILDRVIADSVAGVVVADRAGSIVAISRSAMQLLGLPNEAAAIGRPISAVLPPCLLAAATFGAQDGPGATRQGQERDDADHARAPRVLSYTASVSETVQAEGGEPIQAVCVTFSDVTEAVLAQERITQLALYDTLTGLPNRQNFLQRMERDAGRDVAFRAVIRIDLDTFRRINEDLGQRKGDELLRAVADRIRTATGATFFAARTGGDEFSLIVETPDSFDLARRIGAAISEPFDVDGVRIVLSASVSHAMWPRGIGPDEILTRVGLVLAEAKGTSGTTVRDYSEVLAAARRERDAMARDIAGALLRDEFEVWYQPQVQLATGLPCGVEALLRWRHPDRGLVSPAVFVPVLEETGLILVIGEWVLRRACRDAAELPDAVTVAVNVAPAQLATGDFSATVEKVLKETGLDPARLHLEITEGTFVRDERVVGQEFERLRTLGVGLALDDFGTGYCSLAYIKRFPIRVVKLDKSFIADLPADAHSVAIVQAVTAIARALDLEVVAEGIETPEQSAAAGLLGCHIGQGWLFGRPGPLPAIRPILAAGSVREDLAATAA